MNIYWLPGVLAIAVLMVGAEEKVPDGFQQWTAASLRELDQTLKTEAGANAHKIAMRRLADFPQDTFMLSRREADGVVEWHENQADVFFVQSGSATLLVGEPWLVVKPLNRMKNVMGQFRAVSGASSPREMSCASLPRCRIKSCSMVLLNSHIS